MKVCNTVASVRQIILEQKDNGRSIGFVPTMGALHNGHLSLVKQAGSECSFIVVSIFVNPTQFNDKEDLARYPRNLEKDLELLSNVKCDIVFAPSVEEIYPEQDTRIFNFGNLDKVMEGAHRPGHFNGVGQVVSRLFEIVTPDKAFFGQKDFQQLAIVKNLVTQLGLAVEIVPCPIIREKDGLAMSSRNMLLDGEQRKNAPVISKTLFGALEMSKTRSVAEVKKWVVETIDKNPYLKTEYFEIVDNTTLEPVEQWGMQGNKTGCIAVHCGKIRLIDNVTF